MADHEDQMILKIRGNKHMGWETISVTRSIETAASSFSLGITESWSDPNMETDQQHRIFPAQQCDIYIDGDKILTGYTDSVSYSHSATDHSTTVTGRSLTAALIDCSVVGPYVNQKNQTIERIARTLATPYGIVIINNAQSTMIVPKFKVEQGETVFECIDKLARMDRLLVTDDTDGNLILTRAGTHYGPSFVSPGNILSATGSYDFSDRYTSYRIKGQAAGSDDNYGLSVSGIEAFAVDAHGDRDRVLVIKAERSMTLEQAQIRAEWESVTRTGRACEVTVVVQGWRDDTGIPYEPNCLCRITDPNLRIDAELLCYSVTFNCSESGKTTELKFHPRGAYSMLPMAQQKKGSTPEQIAPVVPPQGSN